MSIAAQDITLFNSVGLVNLNRLPVPIACRSHLLFHYCRFYLEVWYNTGTILHVSLVDQVMSTQSATFIILLCHTLIMVITYTDVIKIEGSHYTKMQLTQIGSSN